MKDGKYFLYEDSEYIPQILREFHNSTLGGGHFGMERILKIISSIFLVGVYEEKKSIHLWRLVLFVSRLHPIIISLWVFNAFTYTRGSMGKQLYGFHNPPP